MISTSDFKRGLLIEVDGHPFQILDVSVQSPTARGGNTLVKTKMRSMLSGHFSNFPVPLIRTDYLRCGESSAEDALRQFRLTSADLSTVPLRSRPRRHVRVRLGVHGDLAVRSMKLAAIALAASLTYCFRASPSALCTARKLSVM